MPGARGRHLRTRRLAAVTRTADNGSSAGFLIHAMVRTPDGALLDIDGVQDPESIELEDEESWREWPSDQARAALAHHGSALNNQDVDAGATFVDPVPVLHAQDQEAMAQAAKDNEAPPDGCRFCGLLVEGHGIQESERFGTHRWVPPADHQREAPRG